VKQLDILIRAMTVRFYSIVLLNNKSDEKLKRLAVVGNCILNQNARAPGIAVHKGVIIPLYEMLKKKGFDVLQLPCPETSFTGVRRWWFVYEQYDSVNYRRHCARLGQLSTRLVEPYYAMGYEIVIIGLGISPTCGVRMRQENNEWKGKPFDVGDRATVREGQGVWIQELTKALDRKKISYRMTDVAPILLYAHERAPKAKDYPKSEEEAWAELDQFLES